MKEEVKAIQSEIKENVQGTKGERKETGTQINNLDQKEEINIHIILRLSKIKDKERILKAAREKETVPYKGVPIKTIS